MSLLSLITHSCPFQIDRASAGNVKLTKMEMVKAELEVEDEFGYTACKFNSFIINKTVTNTTLSFPSQTPQTLRSPGHRCPALDPTLQ